MKFDSQCCSSNEFVSVSELLWFSCPVQLMIVPKQFGQRSHYSFQQKMKHLEHKETKKNTSKRHSQLGGSTQIFSPFFFWEVQISPSNLPTKSSQVSNHPTHQPPPEACQSERPGSIEDVQAALEDGAEASFGHLMWGFSGFGRCCFFLNSFCDR